VTRAQKYSQQTFNANIEALLAHEDTKQAEAAPLPTASASTFIPRPMARLGRLSSTGILAPGRTAGKHFAASCM
jgi:hypothetical protein